MQAATRVAPRRGGASKHWRPWLTGVFWTRARVQRVERLERAHLNHDALRLLCCCEPSTGATHRKCLTSIQIPSEVVNVCLAVRGRHMGIDRDIQDLSTKQSEVVLWKLSV
jgi:hypothetical protein